MPLENGRQGKDKQNPDKLRPMIDEGESAAMVAANDPTEATPGRLGRRAAPPRHLKKQLRDQGRDEAQKPRGTGAD